MKKEIDLSFSGIVDLLQHDTKKGKKLLISVSKNIFSIEKKIEETEKALSLLKNELNYNHSGIDRILKHLELTKPISLTLNEPVDSLLIINNDSNKYLRHTFILEYN